MYSLVIDCSHKENFIGLFRNTDSDWLCERKFSGQPFENLIENLECLLAESLIDRSEIKYFFTPHSPGSTLGIRVTQIMIQGLMKSCCPVAKIIQYNGLHLSALLLLDESPKTDSSTSRYLITENGRHSWTVIKIDANLKIRPEIQQYGLDSLSELTGQFFYIPQMKTWSNPIVDTQKLDYAPHQFLEGIKLLFNLKIDTSLLLPTSNTYVKWNQK